jgi:hypothetical protein
MNAAEVSYIVAVERAPLLRRVGEVLFIAMANHTRFERRLNINAARSQCPLETRAHRVLVKIECERHRNHPFRF